MKIENEYLKEVLEKQSSIIGKDLSIYDKEGWYNANSWTVEQESEFSDWFFDYLYNNSKARRFFLGINIKTKKYIKKAVAKYCYIYGFKLLNK